MPFLSSLSSSLGCFSLSLPSFKRKEKTALPPQKTREKNSSLPLLLALRLMDATAAAAPGPSGSAPRLRVDELLDDVANSVRERGRRIVLFDCADCFSSVVDTSRSAFSLRSRSKRSPFDSSCSVDGDVVPLCFSEPRERKKALRPAGANLQDEKKGRRCRQCRCRAAKRILSHSLSPPALNTQPLETDQRLRQ